MSDKVFKGNRGATGVFFMTLVTIATVVYWLNPPGNPGVDMACMIVIGFLIYGPVMLIGPCPGAGAEKRQARRQALPVCLLPRRFSGGKVPSSVTPSTSSAGTAALW